MVSLSRRRFLAYSGFVGAAAAMPEPLGAIAVPDPLQSSPKSDAVSDIYHRVLHLHTRWVEQQWDSGIKAYSGADFRFTAVLGNAVLLTDRHYDAELAGVARGTLLERTVATIRRFAATNRLAGGDEWGKQLFWDSTFELYFVLAARLLWAELDERTRTRVAAIGSGQAAYAFGLAYADDPLSGDWTPNGAAGGWAGDTKLDEMGVYAQAIAPGLAWGKDDAALHERFAFWASNASGLPTADRANLARLDGLLIKERNRAHNIHDTFIVENHETVNPHYQAEMWRTAGRAAIHFMAAGKPVPEVLLHQPNGQQLWRTLRLLASDAGEPVMPMIADRYHLYGRDVLPLAYLAQVIGDRHAARAEADLAARLEPYLRHDPEYRLAKFSGEDKYEPEARAEIAISYLFHRRRPRPTSPVSSSEFFARASGTRDFGTVVGLTAHQSPAAFAAAVTKTGYVNLLWQPRHDNWLVDTRAAAFLPASARNPEETWTRAYDRLRDGVDATATVLTFGDNFAGYATLPTGTVVYASTGVGTDEGPLTLFNLDMPGVPGLTGRRTFTSATGTITLDGSAGGGGDGGVDELLFEPRTARYVRMQARSAANQYGYSLWTFSVLDEAGADLAQGALPAASSSDVSYPAYNATDGNPETRWAVDRTQRERQDSWFAVDLGSPVTVAGVRLFWESAYATRYVIQTSMDAIGWSDAVAVPAAHEIGGGWVDIDGRAALVTHGTDRPITVTATGVIAATGPASPVLIEGYAHTDLDLPALSRRRIPRTPPSLRASDADGYLTLFNLSPDPVRGATVVIPSTRRLYFGPQVVRRDGLAWSVTQPAATGRVEAPRFVVAGTPPIGTRFEVAGSHRVTVTAPQGQAVSLILGAGAWSAPVQLAAGKSRTVVVPGGPATPTSDLARACTTFPTSPLPVGMTSPANAVDADPSTSWRPGPTGRMVVDLGAVRSVSALRLTWTRGARPPIRVERSTDGVSYPTVARVRKPGRLTEIPLDTSARYVAVVVDGWRRGDAELVELTALG
ncbi:discoidin domain-containing protein [Actinoplanes sp. NPDC049265]|uniref:discoidin domain-containing protein n=1 Tax=Actinoplanes sp. NPDC049265 TaxID=3363902 RepID=UPI0037124C72